MAATDPLSRDTLEAFWMPFTANRQFRAKPRLLARAAGMHYFTPEGRHILDGVAGLWCVNAGHARTEITEAGVRNRWLSTGRTPRIHCADCRSSSTYATTG